MQNIGTDLVFKVQKFFDFPRLHSLVDKTFQDLIEDRNKYLNIGSGLLFRLEFRSKFLKNFKRFLQSSAFFLKILITSCLMKNVNTYLTLNCYKSLEIRVISYEAADWRAQTKNQYQC